MFSISSIKKIFSLLKLFGTLMTVYDCKRRVAKGGQIMSKLFFKLLKLFSRLHNKLRDRIIDDPRTDALTLAAVKATLEVEIELLEADIQAINDHRNRDQEVEKNVRTIRNPW